MTKTRPLLFFLLLVMLLPGCGGQGFLVSDPVESSEMNVGTTVGNPVPIKKLDIAFSLDQTEGSTTNTQNPAPYCREFSVQKKQLKRCHVTPTKLEMGVLGVSLAHCTDSDGRDIVCDSTSSPQIQNELTLHEGQLVSLKLSGEVSSFELNHIPKDESVSVGGLRLVAAYVGYTLPDQHTDPVGASYIDPALRGVAFRVCLSPDDKLSDEEIGAYCGQHVSKMGDLLFDLNHDGVFGFIQPSSAKSDAVLLESTIRPAAYPYSILEDLLQTYRRHANSYLDDLFSGTDHNGNTGFLAQLLPFDNVSTFSPTEINGFEVTYNITHTIKFVEANDLSPGYYNPLSDGPLQVAPPLSTTLTIK